MAALEMLSSTFAEKHGLGGALASVSSIAASGATIPTGRQARAREVYARNIRFANGSSHATPRKQQVSGGVERFGVLHRNANGWLVVALNDDGEPIAPALTDMRGYTPVRTRRVERTALVPALLQRWNVRRVFCNDGSLLTPTATTSCLRDDEQFTVTGYQGTFVDGLTAARTAYQAARHSACQQTATSTDENGHAKRNSTTPSYETIRQLDPTITRADYRRIYMTQA